MSLRNSVAGRVKDGDISKGMETGTHAPNTGKEKHPVSQEDIQKDTMGFIKALFVIAVGVSGYLVGINTSDAFHERHLRQTVEVFDRQLNQMTGSIETLEEVCRQPLTWND